MPAFGRNPSPDSRDANFLMRMVLEAEPPPPLPTYKYWTRGLPLDQGNDGICVGASWEGFLRSSPIRTTTGPDMHVIYCEACGRDEWTANDPCDKSFGTSVRAAVEALVGRGHVAQYVWATDVRTISEWVRGKSPVVMGTWWKDGMMSVDSKGFIHATGGILGGHAWLLNGANDVARKFRGQQSWGPGPWGRNNGIFYISYDDVAQLLAEEGECCAAIESRVL